MAEEEFECAECGETFDTEKGLSIHKSKVHDAALEEEPAEENEMDGSVDDSEPEMVVLQNVKTNPRRRLGVSLARPVLEEGEPVTYDERYPEDAPKTIHPTGQSGSSDTNEYRTRRGQRRMKDLGEEIYFAPRGEDGDKVEVERDVLRAPDIKGRIDRGDLRVVSE